MDAKQKRTVVDDIKALLPFIQAESIGNATQKAIVKILGRPDEYGLVRWCNEHSQTQTLEGQAVKDTIQILVRLYARFGLFSKQYTDQASQLQEAARLLPKKIAILDTLCVDSKKPKLSKDEVKPTLKRFLVEKMDSGERFRSQKAYSQDFHAMYGAGSLALVNAVLAGDERLKAWSKDKSVSAKSYAEVYATAQAYEYVDEIELEKAFLNYVEKRQPTEEQKTEALQVFRGMDPRQRKEMLDTLDS